MGSLSVLLMHHGLSPEAVKLHMTKFVGANIVGGGGISKTVRPDIFSPPVVEPDFRFWPLPSWRLIFVT